MKTSLKIAVVALVAFFATTSAYAQEWTKVQKEVWQVAEDSWTKWKAGDLAGMTAYIHEKYQGWSDDQPLPVSKEQVVQWYTAMKDIMKVEFFYLNPARIVVTENVAVVDYYFWYKATYTWGEKKEMKESQGKNAEFYVKEGGKWLLIGDLTIHADVEDDGGEE